MNTMFISSRTLHLVLAAMVVMAVGRYVR